jgi:hypothetical protein
MDRRPNARVRPASADVGHRNVDFIICRIWFLPQEGYGRHDLSRLAVAALRHVELLPCNLHRMGPVGRKAFDRRYFRTGGSLDRKRTGARRPPVDMNGTSATLSNAAGELGARETYGITKHPTGAEFPVPLLQNAALH